MAQIEFQLSGDDRAACVPLWKTEMVTQSPERSHFTLMRILLIGAPIPPWRVGEIPAPGGGPVSRSGEWIRPAKSPKAAHRGQALLLRGVAAV
jgi:hypothetical protein